MKFIPYGPNALLVQFANEIGEEAFARSCAIAAELERHPPPGLAEFVPGFTSILLEFDSHLGSDLTEVASELEARLKKLRPSLSSPALPKEIPVIYDGPDLDRVARSHKLTSEQVCHLHAEPIYKVYLLGFAPGFPYLGDLNPRLHTPRLASPRPRVPAGSVAIGGAHTGIYTVDSPGGWNIIGHTPVKIFDPDRRGPAGDAEGMFYLKQGDRVKFVPADGNA